MAAYGFINGNLTKDPTSNEYNGKKMARLTVATQTTRKDANGKYASNFYDCTVWGVQADYVMKHFQKGTNVNVIGEIVRDDYTGNDGVTRTSLQCNVINIQGITRLKGASEAPQASAAQAQAAQPASADSQFPW